MKSTFPQMGPVATTLIMFHQMLRLYYRAHQQADTAGGHSTEENLLTIQDLRWLRHY